MTREELARAVRLPAEKQGRAFETGLVDRIVDDVGEKAGSLPLLEFALTKLWDLQEAGWLTHDAYERIGRVECAVARHADAVYGGLGWHSAHLDPPGGRAHCGGAVARDEDAHRG